ncbi:MAG: hypothetical protein H6873_12790 [Hyphomicrobiaceae bacterium]|nr:hypothetical protein [Hyphomicrobiaceae bacterium]
MVKWAGWVYLVLTVVIVLFQLALVGGAPWGDFALGGQFPGQLPPAIRVVSLVNVLILLLLGTVVAQAAALLNRLRFTFPRYAMWLVVGFSAVALFVNLITPSAGERMIWAPVAAVMLLSSVIVAWQTRKA